ncbi:transcriptional regulator [Pseudonocardiaceae bacterium YIM PH 21723]|nr:transcriptional regulator [Pseudonocardiaceae bacterium YIM PH 21723]
MDKPFLGFPTRWPSRLPPVEPARHRIRSDGPHRPIPPPRHSVVHCSVRPLDIVWMSFRGRFIAVPDHTDLPSVQLLGPVTAYLGNAQVELGPPRQRAVLAILAVSVNRPVSRREIIDGVWGENAPSSADNGVHTYVAGLRRVLEPRRGHREQSRLITSVASGYQLNLDRALVDAAAFTDLVAEGDLDAALDLWRGSALDGIPGPFAELERSRLADMRLDAVEQRAERRLADGRPQEVIAELTGLVAAHPLREALHGLLMRALSRAGRQAEALAAYQRARSLLADELGVDPGPALQRIHQQILTAEAEPEPTPVPVTPARTVPAQLPLDVRAFTGREAEMGRIQELARQAADTGTTLALITAAGGIGKSALAVRAAHQVSELFPDGQLYLNLRGFDPDQPPTTPQSALFHLLRGLGVPPERVPDEVDEQSAHYRSLLSDRRMLIVLDNAGSVGQVRPLLPGRSHCLVLITSRNQLGGLIIRDGAHPFPLPTLDDGESTQLLNTIVGAARVAAEPEAAARLSVLCGHMPLALRIAAERLALRPHLSLDDLVADLTSAQSRLSVLDVDEDSAVRVVFASSYLTLKPEAARLFRLLSLQPAGQFGSAAVAAVAGLPHADARRLLGELVDGHLVEETGRDRYQLHDLLRLYAGEKAVADETEQARRDAVTRLLDWYLNTVKAACAQLNPAHQPLGEAAVLEPMIPLHSHQAGFDWCELELVNLVAAGQLGREYGRPDYGWKIPAVLWNFFHLVKSWAAWGTIAKAGLECARADGNVQGEAWSLHALGLTAWGVGRHSVSVQYFQRALELREGLKDEEHVAWTLAGLGLATAGLRRFPEAIEYLYQALDQHRAIGSVFGEGGLLIYLAETRLDSGDPQGAFDNARQAHELFATVGIPLGVGHALTALAQSSLALGRTMDAAYYAEQAVEVRGNNGDRQGLADSLLCWGKAQLSMGDTAEAQRHLNGALVIYAERDHPAADEVRALLS